MSQQEALGTNDVNLYGGNVKKFAKARCECGKKYLLWLKPEYNTFRVITMSNIASEVIQEEKETIEPTMTVLRSLAKERGINSFGMNKQALIDALKV